MPFQHQKLPRLPLQGRCPHPHWGGLSHLPHLHVHLLRHQELSLLRGPSLQSPSLQQYLLLFLLELHLVYLVAPFLLHLPDLFLHLLQVLLYLVEHLLQFEALVHQRLLDALYQRGQVHQGPNHLLLAQFPGSLPGHLLQVHLGVLLRHCLAGQHHHHLLVHQVLLHLLKVEPCHLPHQLVNLLMDRQHPLQEFGCSPNLKHQYHGGLAHQSLLCVHLHRRLQGQHQSHLELFLRLRKGPHQLCR